MSRPIPAAGDAWLTRAEDEARAALRELGWALSRMTPIPEHGVSSTWRAGTTRVVCRVLPESRNTAWAWVSVQVRTADPDATIVELAEVSLASQPAREEWRAAIDRATQLAEKRLRRMLDGLVGADRGVP